MMFKTIILAALLFSTGSLFSQNKDTIPVVDNQQILDCIVANRVPATGLSLPAPYRQGYLGVVGGGLFLQQRTRITGQVFDPDGNASFSVGLGNPEKWVGCEVRVNIYGLDNKRGAPGNFGEGTLDFHFSRHIGHDLWLGAGVFDLFGWKPEPPNKLTSYYLSAIKVFHLNQSSSFFHSVYLSAGTGNGKFRRDADYSIYTKDPWNFYAGLAVQVLPEGNLIVEYNGYNAFTGFSVLPFRKVPFQLVGGVDDLFHENKKIILTGSVSFYLFKKHDRSQFGRLSLIPPPPPQTSRVQ